VSGEPLGARGPAVPVETVPDTTQQAPFWRRLFGSPPPPRGIVIYVCCQECAARVKSDPGLYLARVIAQRAGYRAR
jgi:hypothetical protein